MSRLNDRTKRDLTVILGFALAGIGLSAANRAIDDAANSVEVPSQTTSPEDIIKEIQENEAENVCAFVPHEHEICK